MFYATGQLAPAVAGVVGDVNVDAMNIKQLPTSRLSYYSRALKSHILEFAMRLHSVVMDVELCRLILKNPNRFSSLCFFLFTEVYWTIL